MVTRGYPAQAGLTTGEPSERSTRWDGCTRGTHGALVTRPGRTQRIYGSDDTP